MSRIYLAYRSKKQRFCAVQAFCAAKPWRRANSLRPSILIPDPGFQNRNGLHCKPLLFWSGRRGSLAALPCRDTHSGHQTPHWGVFSLRSRPVRPSARWSQKIGAFAPYKRLRSKTLAEGEFTSPEHFNFLPESKKEVTTYVVTSFLERATRLELATSTLARWRSTR